MDAHITVNRYGLPTLVFNKRAYTVYNDRNERILKTWIGYKEAGGDFLLVFPTT